MTPEQELVEVERHLKTLKIAQHEMSLRHESLRDNALLTLINSSVYLFESLKDTLNGIIETFNDRSIERMNA
jgi:hypothetical protein